MHTHDGRARAVTGSDFLQSHGVGQVTGVTTAPLLRHQHAEKAQLGHFTDSFPGKTVLAIPFGGERFQAFLGELPGHVADLGLFFSREHGDSLIQAFDGHGRGFAAANANGRDAALEPLLAQG
ncbi:hypothetical protein BSF43_27970 [Pseudomonas ogarae]|nr:hypothetical protein BSF43_27970 [Pseudomonas ogarae]